MEREIKLSVVSQQLGDSVLAHLAVMEAAGPYTFAAAVPTVLRDIYYDTAAGCLRKARVAFRVRWQNGQPRITVKGQEVWNGDLASRAEFEAELDADTLALVLGPLQAQRLLPPLEVPLVSLLAGEPAGPLSPILVTRTHRVARILHNGSNGLPVAVLSLDRVYYTSLPDQPVCNDVEIEALPAGTDEDLAAVQRLVTQDLDSLLRPVRESKLARGLRLLGEDRISAAVALYHTATCLPELRRYSRETNTRPGSRPLLS